MPPCLSSDSGDDKFARRTYKSLKDSVSTIPMGQDSDAFKMLMGALRRLELPGHEMPLEGKTLDGKDFKLASLKGKVVLVGFWATGLREAMEELKNVSEQYAKHHDKGFEVVGINLGDDDAAQLADFYKKNAITWTNCRDKDAVHSVAEYYGVFVSATPMLILVGRSGKVLSLHAKGPDLESLIDKALAGTLVVTPVADDDKPRRRRHGVQGEGMKRSGRRRRRPPARRRPKRPVPPTPRNFASGATPAAVFTARPSSADWPTRSSSSNWKTAP